MARLRYSTGLGMGLAVIAISVHQSERTQLWSMTLRKGRLGRWKKHVR